MQPGGIVQAWRGGAGPRTAADRRRQSTRLSWVLLAGGPAWTSCLITAAGDKCRQVHLTLRTRGLQQRSPALTASGLPNDHGRRCFAWLLSLSLAPLAERRVTSAAPMTCGQTSYSRSPRASLATARGLRRDPHARRGERAYGTATAIRNHLPVSGAGAYLFPTWELLRTLGPARITATTTAETLESSNTLRFRSGTADTNIRELNFRPDTTHANSPSHPVELHRLAEQQAPGSTKR